MESHGVLTTVHGTLYFLSDAGALAAIEPQHCPFLMPLEEIGVAETQALMDKMRGGAAFIATHRAQEVA